jgi:hypothetical protein
MVAARALYLVSHFSSRVRALLRNVRMTDWMRSEERDRSRNRGNKTHFGAAGTHWTFTTLRQPWTITESKGHDFTE